MAGSVQDAGEPRIARARFLDPQLLAIGLAGGVLSGLLGVGGGIVMVPLLVIWAGYAQRDAHAMSLGAIVPISVAGVLTYGIAGQVRLPEATALAVGAVVGARVGAGLLSRLGDRPLKLAFGSFLVAVAVLMAVRQ
ncbi:MAG TPA: sulfite exporter TauE/SafE family protein [Gaiellaceae bacterium]